MEVCAETRAEWPSSSACTASRWNGFIFERVLLGQRLGHEVDATDAAPRARHSRSERHLVMTRVAVFQILGAVVENDSDGHGHGGSGGGDDNGG